MKTLTIRLAGPLQSYGNQANFKYRTTYRHPSKSAVLGMIAAALGYKYDDPRTTQLNELSFAVRTDQIDKMLTDFQTIDVGEKHPKIAYCDYWEDAVFVVAVAGPDKEIEQIKYALYHPAFQLYFGRKCAAPAGVLQTGVYDEKNPVEVLKSLPWQASKSFMRSHRLKPKWPAEICADASLLPKLPSSLVKDAIGSFSLRERYHVYRAEAVTNVHLKNPNYKPSQDYGSGTDQDVWGTMK